MASTRHMPCAASRPTKATSTGSPLPDDSVDAAVTNMVLHHAPRPGRHDRRDGPGDPPRWWVAATHPAGSTGRLLGAERPICVCGRSSRSDPIDGHIP